MSTFSSDYKRSPDPYLKKLKRHRTLVGVLIILAVLVVLVLVAWGTVFYINKSSENKVTQEQIMTLWESNNYTAVNEACLKVLEKQPLEPFYLIFNGFSAFYLALNETDTENRAIKMDQVIFSLRKVLNDSKAPLKGQTNYILGKAYFHKGKNHYPDALEYLKNAIQLGYVNNDIYEYMALAAQGCEDISGSIEYFAKALELKTDSAALMLAAAQANISAEKIDVAEALLKKSLETTTDVFLAERCQFMLADIYRKEKKYSDAIACYNLIKEKNPQSADAWFYHGLVLIDMGETMQARAAWRKAIAIDPMHAGARAKLAERL